MEREEMYMKDEMESTLTDNISLKWNLVRYQQLQINLSYNSIETTLLCMVSLVGGDNKYNIKNVDPKWN